MQLIRLRDKKLVDLTVRDGVKLCFIFTGWKIADEVLARLLKPHSDRLVRKINEKTYERTQEAAYQDKGNGGYS